MRAASSVHSASRPVRTRALQLAAVLSLAASGLWTGTPTAMAQCATCANPSLPVGDNAIGASAGTGDAGNQLQVRAAVSVIQTAADKLYKGSKQVDNYLNLDIALWMVASVLAVDTPWGQTLQGALPWASLTHEQNFQPRATDTGIGDAEFRIRQDGSYLLGQKSGPRWGLSIGATAPTGTYIGAKKTNYLFYGNSDTSASREYSIGRGVWWLLAELDARQPVGTRTTLFGQVGLRAPVTYAVDNFGWGNEVRSNLGANVRLVGNWLSATVIGELQARENSTFVPDVGAGKGVRQRFANGGGFWTFATPSVTASWQPDWGSLGISVSARVPVYQNVIGEQLIQNPAYFLTITGQYGVSLGGEAKPAPVALPRAITGKVGELSPVPEIAAAVQPGHVTIVDYWATWCPPCVELAPDLEAFAASRPDVRLHKVNATAWEVEDWQHYLPEVEGLPVLDVFGPDQKLIKRLTGEDAKRYRSLVPAPAVSASTPTAP